MKLFKNTCLIDDVLQHHCVGDQLIVDHELLLLLGIVGLEHPSATEVQEVGEFVEGLDLVRAVGGGFQGSCRLKVKITPPCGIVKLPNRCDRIPTST